MSDIKNVLVTGGAGFIGSHLTDKLIAKGYNVRILDNLTEQVHQGKIPEYVNPKAEFIKGDVTNIDEMKRALDGMDAVYHHAAAVGVGQSMYEMGKYVYENSVGTARLLDVLANNPHTIKRIFVASSMSAYGEGLYECPTHGRVRPDLRPTEQMSQKDWEPRCAACHAPLKPIPTPETEKFACNSVYAVTKQSQEDLVMIFGRAYGVPATAFRYFNVYGPRQSLSNPYTGVAAIFLSRLKNDHVPVVYEDGLQSRDFVSVYDVADANVAALENPNAHGQIFNLGTGIPIAIKEVGSVLAKLLGKDIQLDVNGNFRAGDVRHCYADISKLKERLGWAPSWDFEKGMRDLIAWGEHAEAEDLFDQASKELSAKGLLKS